MKEGAALPFSSLSPQSLQLFPLSLYPSLLPFLFPFSFVERKLRPFFLFFISRNSSKSNLAPFSLPAVLGLLPRSREDPLFFVLHGCNVRCGFFWFFSNRRHLCPTPPLPTKLFFLLPQKSATSSFPIFAPSLWYEMTEGFLHARRFARVPPPPLPSGFCRNGGSSIPSLPFLEDEEAFAPKFPQCHPFPIFILNKGND